MMAESRTPAELLQALHQAEADLDAKRHEIAELARELETTNRGIIALHVELDDARRSEAQLAAIVRSSDDAIFSMALDKSVSNWNLGAEYLLGYREDEIAGQLATSLFPEASATDFEAALRRVQGGGRASPYDSWCLRSNGSLVEVSVTISAMRDPAGILVGYSAVVSDITERRRAEEDLAIARAEREVFEDRDRIARDLHDHVIQQLFGSGMALQSVVKLAPPGQVSERIRAVVDDLDRTILQIRTSIFGLHRPETASAVRAQVLDVTVDARGSLGFEPQVQFKGPVDALVSDLVAEHLLAVLREALSNASRHADASKVEVRIDAGEEITLSVSDNGKGMGETTRRSGLANLADRATLLGGSFSVAGAPGGGTQIEWKVPRNPGPAAGE